MLETLINNSAGVLATIRLRDILDILIITFAIYKIIKFINGTRARQLVQGLLILVGAMLISGLLGLNTVYYLLNSGLRYGIMAIIVIFYPELRRALEFIGRGKFGIERLINSSSEDLAGKKKMIREMITAIEHMSESQTGALIIIEKDVALGDILEHGTIINAYTTAPLLETIFYEGSALHDGAVILRGGKVFAAGCVLPLSSNVGLEKTLGTRHRAGLGITEVSDAIAIIVSEETGIVSVASEGRLSRFMDLKSIEKILYDTYVTEIADSDNVKPIMNIFRRNSSDE